MIKKNKGYKFRLQPTEEQKVFFAKTFGCVRKIYNINVNLLYEFLERNSFVDGYISGFRNLTPAKYKGEFEYLKEVDSLALANANLNFRGAISKYNKEAFKKEYKKSALKRAQNTDYELSFRDLKGMPSFKRKYDEQSYSTNNQNGTVKIVDDCYVKLPKLKSLVKFVNHRSLPQDAVIKSATISRDCRGKHYISFCVEYYEKEIEVVEPKKAIGLDYAQNDFYVDSEGKKANYPRYYRDSEARLAREQRKLSKMEMKSSNWIKQKLKVAILQGKTANQRRDWLHKRSLELAKQYDAVIFEDIDLRTMAQCLSLGKNLYDNGFGMFRVFCEYKLAERGKHFVKIDKWFPSSKTCNSCGQLNSELKLQDKIWTCDSCKSKLDRDYNAALNIRDEGIKLLQNI